MSGLWIGNGGGWTRRELASGDAPVLTGDPARPARFCSGVCAARGPRLVTRADGTGHGRILVAPVPGDRVLVNGEQVMAGIRVLRDRDEILVRSVRVYFSSERLARIEPLPADIAPTPCRRCMRPIEAGRPAVRCPSCGVWHHEDPEKRRPCWSYAGTCARCDHPTAMDVGYRWEPERDD